MLKRLAPVLLVALVIALVFGTGAHRHVTFEALVTRRTELAAFVEARPLFAALGFVALYAAVAALSIPGGVILTLASGFVFGALLGGALSVAGATIGAVLIFLIARTALGDALRGRAGGRLDALKDGFSKDAASYLLFLRLTPVFPFWVVNLAAAVFGAPLLTFALTTFFGIMPATFAFAFAGSGLDAVIDTARADQAACRAANASAACALELPLHALVTPKVLAALGALGLVALLPVLLRRFRGASPHPTPPGRMP